MTLQDEYNEVVHKNIDLSRGNDSLNAEVTLLEAEILSKGKWIDETQDERDAARAKVELLTAEGAILQEVVDEAMNLEATRIDDISEMDRRQDALWAALDKYRASVSGSQKLPSVHAVHPQKENHMFHPGGNADYCICGAGKADAIHRLAPVDSNLCPESPDGQHEYKDNSGGCYYCSYGLERVDQRRTP